MNIEYQSKNLSDEVRSEFVIIISPIGLITTRKFTADLSELASYIKAQEIEVAVTEQTQIFCGIIGIPFLLLLDSGADFKELNINEIASGLYGGIDSVKGRAIMLKRVNENSIAGFSQEEVDHIIKFLFDDMAIF